MPAKGAREARPFVAEAFFCICSIFFALFSKNGPGSFPHARLLMRLPRFFCYMRLSSDCCAMCTIWCRGVFFVYSTVWKKESSRKIPEKLRKIPKMGVRRARSARRTPIFGIFPDFLEFSGFVFHTILYITNQPVRASPGRAVSARRVLRKPRRALMMNDESFACRMSNSDAWPVPRSCLFFLFFSSPCAVTTATGGSERRPKQKERGPWVVGKTFQNVTRKQTTSSVVP